MTAGDDFPGEFEPATEADPSRPIAFLAAVGLYVVVLFTIDAGFAGFAFGVAEGVVTYPEAVTIGAIVFVVYLPASAIFAGGVVLGGVKVLGGCWSVVRGWGGEHD